MYSQKNIPFTIDLLKSSFEYLPIPLCMINRDGIIIIFNQAYGKFLHINSEEALGKHIYEVISNSKLPLVMETGIQEINCAHHFTDGRTAIGSRIPVYYENKVVGCIGYILFENNHKLQQLAVKYKEIENEIKKYKNILESRNFSKYNVQDIIGESDSIKKCIGMALKMASIDLPILVLGENGVGKELIVHAIHNASSRKYNPFIRVNCTTIPKELFESEFFGYEKGSFSGAKQEGKKGFFELADKGTIFLDEVGDLPLEMQGKLLRVLQEREFIRVGGEEIIECKARVVAATNKDIKRMVKQGLFREDLYYRLNILILTVPPLRERKEDIPQLSNYFLRIICEENGICKKSFTNKALSLLSHYQWPGNIRELRNVITRAALFSKNNVISYIEIANLLNRGKEEVPAAFTKEKEGNSALPDFKNYIDDREKDYMLQVLKECDGNKAKAARKLGIHRSSLYRKLNKYSF